MIFLFFLFFLGIRYFTGETPRLLIGKNFCNMIHKEDVKRVRPKFRALLQQGSRSSNNDTASVWPTEAGPIRYRRKKSGGGYLWVEAVGHSVGIMTGVKSSSSSSSSPKSTRNTLVFSERDIGRYMELEAKLAHAQGVTLDAAVDSADRSQHGTFGNMNMSGTKRTSTVGDQTRAAAMASAGNLGQRR